jgi:hypothetical protein
METPPKLSALFHTDGTLMEVTPLGEGSAKITDVAALLEKILHLLMEDPDEHLPPVLKQFFTHLSVCSWEDMVVFSSHDVEEEIKESKNPGPLKLVLLCKKLGYIFEFAKFGTLDTETTMNHIVHVVKEAKAGSTKGEEIVKKVGLDKKIVPTLEKFSGNDEDFYAFQDSTMNQLGQAGLAHYLTDADVVNSNKEVAEVVFYAIHSSFQGSDARSLAMALYDAKTLDPFWLWSDIVAYYDTDINQANIILFDVKHLLSLQLDPDVTPTSFIANFKECLLSLQKHNTKLAEDTDTLHALLLVAIQDIQFETIHDNIIHKPTLSIDEILKDIREHDTSMQMKDGGCNITGDGTSLSEQQTAT